MSGGEALDLALGLLRAPARRGLLVARPLPTGMTTLLEVAGGSTRAANTASEATGATPEELLEASRFFVQQVLFHEGANAYRILGARPDAPQSQLLHHHRLLQRWLHPDRDGGQAWDSAFSARVNEAWNRVRTPHARRAYDAELAAQGPMAALRPSEPDAAGDPAALVPTRRVPPPPPSPARSIAGPLAVIPVTAACLGLLWLAQHRETPATETEIRHRPADPTGRPDAADAPPPQSTAATPDNPIALIAQAIQSPDPTIQADIPESTPPVGHPDVADAPPARIHATASIPASSEAPATIAGIGGGHADPSFAERRGRSPDLQGDAPHVVAPTPVAQADTPQSVRRPNVAAADARPASAAPDLQSLADTDPLQLLEEAQHTAAQATAYLASDGSHIPPIWNDFSTEVAAAEARARLAMRSAAPAPGQMHLLSPQWRMGTEQAGLDAGYRLGREGGTEEGRLRLEMTRREQRWLVTNLSLEPAP